MTSSGHGSKDYSAWRAFWARPNRIYVNGRHLAVHCRQVADDILRLDPGADAAVLDYGCGEALEAGRLAAAVRRLYLYDTAEPLRARLLERHAGDARVAVLDEASLERLEPASLDLIVVNSVVQYMAAEELSALLAKGRRWLKRSGRMVIADVIPPGSSPARDAAELLRLAWREGFLMPALRGLALTFLSDYRILRRRQPLSTYTEESLRKAAAAHGLTATREPRNLGFNQGRMTFTLRPGRDDG